MTGQIAVAITLLIILMANGWDRAPAVRPSATEATETEAMSIVPAKGPEKVPSYRAIASDS